MKKTPGAFFRASLEGVRIMDDAHKISRVSIYRKTLPLEKPYRLSSGRLLFENRDSTFVRIETDAGLNGWGEGGILRLPIFYRCQ